MADNDKLDAKLALRAATLEPKRLSAADLRNLDSSLKRNTAFVKKVCVCAEGIEFSSVC